MGFEERPLQLRGLRVGGTRVDTSRLTSSPAVTHQIERTERDLTVGQIRARPGESLAVDAVIMDFA